MNISDVMGGGGVRPVCLKIYIGMVIFLISYENNNKTFSFLLKVLLLYGMG